MRSPLSAAFSAGPYYKKDAEDWSLSREGQRSWEGYGAQVLWGTAEELRWFSLEQFGSRRGSGELCSCGLPLLKLLRTRCVSQAAFPTGRLFSSFSMLFWAHRDHSTSPSPAAPPAHTPRGHSSARRAASPSPVCPSARGRAGGEALGRGCRGEGRREELGVG